MGVWNRTHTADPRGTVTEVPIEEAIDKEAGVIRRKYTGMVSGEEIIANFDETVNRPEYRPGMKSLMDFRGYEHQLDSKDMRKMAEFFIEHAESVKGAKAAVVVAHTVSYGLVRMLQVYVEAAPVQVEVFFEMEEAERWLGI